MNERIIEQLVDTFKQDFELTQNDLGALEQAVREKMQLLGKGLLQKLVDSGSHGYQGSSIACKCGESMKFVQHRPKNIHTVFGWIKVKRSYYYCPDCGYRFVPFDKASGLGIAVSRLIIKVCADCLSNAHDIRQLESLILKICNH